MEVHALRLHPDQDLLNEMLKWAVANDIEAACVLTCVGSLKRANLRFANKPDGTQLEGMFEIVALTGTLSKHGSHFHIALSDGDGVCVGGHLLAGCPIYTTAEIVLGIVPGKRFIRPVDDATTWDELYIVDLD